MEKYDIFVVLSQCAFDFYEQLMYVPLCTLYSGLTAEIEGFINVLSAK